MDERDARIEWFKTIVLPHEASVRARLRRICPPGLDLENLVAESLSRAYAVKDFKRVTAGSSYLFTIAKNMLLDEVRRNTIVSFDVVADLDALQIDETFEPCLTARDELRRLHALIERLPNQSRRVFLLRRVFDYSPGEIAERLSLSVSTVEKHLAKAIQHIAKGLEGEDERGEATVAKMAKTFVARRRSVRKVR